MVETQQQHIEAMVLRSATLLEQIDKHAINLTPTRLIWKATTLHYYEVNEVDSSWIRFYMQTQTGQVSSRKKEGKDHLMG